MRQIHHWAALVFVAAIAVHMMRIFFTGAFRKPREANWIVGVTLFVLALLEGFAGYSLPDDLLSGTGLRTAATIVGSIPVVGTYLELFVFGGQFPGDAVIPRLYPVHVLLVPGLIVALITAHLILVIYLKHTHWAGQGKTNKNAVGSPAFPHFTAKTTGFFLMVFGVLTLLGALAQINPVWNYGPYRANQVSGNAQPDWYVGFLEGALRLMPPWETDIAGHTIMWNVFIPAIVLPGVVFTVLFLYPFFEKWVTSDRREHHLCDRPRNRPTRTGLGVAAIVFYAVLLVMRRRRRRRLLVQGFDRGHDLDPQNRADRRPAPGLRAGQTPLPRPSDAGSPPTDRGRGDRPGDTVGERRSLGEPPWPEPDGPLPHPDA